MFHIVSHALRVCAWKWYCLAQVYVFYKLLWLRDVNAMALSSIVRCECVLNANAANETTMTRRARDHDNDRHTYKRILMAKANTITLLLSCWSNLLVNERERTKKWNRLPYSDEWECRTSPARSTINPHILHSIEFNTALRAFENEGTNTPNNYIGKTFSAAE